MHREPHSTADGATENHDNARSRRVFLGQFGGLVAGAGAMTRAGSVTADTGDSTSVSTYLLAVTKSNTGLPLPVTVEVAPGDGTLLVDIGRVGLHRDMQAALREAIDFGRRFRNQSIEGREITVSFGVPSEAKLELDGKSGEATLTAAIVAALGDQSLDTDTFVTGAVANDGTLLPVGGIRPKAEAARALGADKLLVPPGQATEVAGIDIIAVPGAEAVLDRALDG